LENLTTDIVVSSANQPKRGNDFVGNDFVKILGCGFAALGFFVARIFTVRRA
jgi:hypothetical protein